MLEQFLNKPPGSTLPLGTILPVLQGYFDSGSNTNYSSELIGLNNSWYPCDGSAPNDIESPIWNLPNRYVPNMEGKRFLMGTFLYSGQAGGLDERNHNHNIFHGHRVSSFNLNSSGNHLHQFNIISNVTISNVYLGSSVGYTQGSFSSKTSEPTPLDHNHELNLVFGNVSADEITNTSISSSFLHDNKPRYLGIKFYIKIK